MKRIFCFLLVISSLQLYGQQIAVKSFKALPFDVTARIDAPVLDKDGKKCALIKVVTSETGFAFEGGSLGVMETKQRIGEIWVYVPRGAKKLTILHSNLGVLRDYLFPEAIEIACVYEMVLTTAKVTTVIEEPEILTEWVTFSSTPDSADIYLDDQYLGKTPLSKKLKEGSYAYRLEKSWYHNDAGVFTVDTAVGKKNIEGKLREAFGYAQIVTTPESGAEIEIDDIPLANNSPCKSPRLKSGTHTLTAKKVLYKTQTQTFTVEDGITKTITVALIPNFAQVSVTTSPVATIYIDTEKMATGTYSGKLLAGFHTITAKRDKYTDASQTFDAVAGENKTVNLKLIEITGNLDIVSTPFDAQYTIKSTDADNTAQYTGTTPNTIRNLLIGNYTVTITKSGYATETQAVKITENTTKEINVVLSNGLQVQIISEPTGSQLYIDSIYAGQTPYKALLSFGTHTIKLTNTDTELQESITIETGGKTLFEFTMPTTTNIEMISVAGGTFQMGSTDGESDQKPVHSVTVSSFKISKYEITNAQFCEFLNDYGSDKVKSGTYAGETMIYEHDWGVKKSGSTWQPQSGYENHPVVYVTWFGANAFCEWAGGRLPTEAEWEFAARGGVETQFIASNSYKYAGSNTIGDVAWYADNSDSKTHKVGDKSPNELGIYDMSGNVWEWCADWYDEKYYSSSPKNDPLNTKKADSRVLRGGSWNYYDNYCRVAYRNRGNPNDWNYSVGFRLVVF